MERKKFLQKGLIGFGTILSVPTILAACSKNSNDEAMEESIIGDCDLSPKETVGPFPIKTPSQLVMENIVGDRNGVALLINLTIQDQSNNCEPLTGVYVDVWHCDAKGDYSEYGGTQMQSTNYTNAHFLRGRQTTDANGQVSFISVFPGWYNGRAPHIHIEVLNTSENSIRVTQIAFPKSICDTVYATSSYNGEANTLNTNDNVFADSIAGNMADALIGDTTNGYTLTKTIVV